MARVAVVSEETVREIVTRQIAFDAVRAAFEAAATDGAQVFEVALGKGLHSSQLFAIKSGTVCEHELVGFKCGTYWAGNFDRGLPAHSSTIMMLDSDTGFPRALVSAMHLNGYRTAAADAVAVCALARGDAAVLGVIGAGHQAEQEIRAVAEVRALSLIKISTRSEKRAGWMADRLRDLEAEVRFTTAEVAVRGSDIVATVTPSEAPLVCDEWIEDGTHISAMGADDVGKQELDTAILRRARVFADHPAQSIRIGEFQHAYRDGFFSSADDICALGSVTLGSSPGRTCEAEITVFDSSGIAIQDLAVANAILEVAERADLVDYIDL